MYKYIHTYICTTHTCIVKKANVLDQKTTLYCPATLCNPIEHPATPCNTLQHPATPCNTLQHPATPCNTLQHPGIVPITKWHGTHNKSKRFGSRTFATTLGLPSHTCDLSRVYVFYLSEYVYDIGMIHLFRVLMRDTTLSYMCHDSFICVPSYMCHDSFKRVT